MAAASEDFARHKRAKLDEYALLQEGIKRMQDELAGTYEKIKFTQDYVRCKKPASPEEAIRYKAALIYFKKSGLEPGGISLKDLFGHLKELKAEKAAMAAKAKATLAELKILQRVEKNIESALGIQMSEAGQQAAQDSGKKGSRQKREHSR